MLSQEVPLLELESGGQETVCERSRLQTPSPLRTQQLSPKPGCAEASSPPSTSSLSNEVAAHSRDSVTSPGSHCSLLSCTAAAWGQSEVAVCLLGFPEFLARGSLTQVLICSAPTNSSQAETDGWWPHARALLHPALKQRLCKHLQTCPALKHYK